MNTNNQSVNPLEENNQALQKAPEPMISSSLDSTREPSENQASIESEKKDTFFVAPVEPSFPHDTHSWEYPHSTIEPDTFSQQDVPGPEAVHPEQNIFATPDVNSFVSPSKNIREDENWSGWHDFGTSTGKKTRVVIIDDQTILREMLSAVLLQDPEYEVIGQCGDGNQAIELCQELKPDIVILDAMLPGTNGAEVLTYLKKRIPKTKFLIVTVQNNPRLLQRFLKLGAVGIVNKNSALNCLQDALREVQKNRNYFCPVMASIMRNQVLSTPDKELEDLSLRECQVLRMLAEGFSAKEIHQKLELSIKTIENHRQNIMKKLNIHDVVGLTHYAIKHGLVELQ